MASFSQKSVPVVTPPQPTEDDRFYDAHFENLTPETAAASYGAEKPDYRQTVVSPEQVSRNAEGTPSWGQEFTRGLYRGIDELGATGYAAMGAASEAIGANDIADWSYDKYLDQMQDAEYNRGTVESIKDINTLDGLARYAIGGVASNLPMFLPGLATGGVGGMIAKKAAADLVTGWAVKYGAENAAKMVAKRVAVGQGLGAYAGSAGMEVGQIAGQNREESGSFRPDIAIPAGLMAGGLDAIPQIKILGNVFGKEITSGITRRLVSRVGKEALETGLMEAPTEAIQTVIENVANKMASPTPGKWTEQDWWDVADAAAQGFLGGAALGGASGIRNNGPRLAVSSNPGVNEKVQQIRQGAKAKVVDPTADSFEVDPHDVALADAQDKLDAIHAQIAQEGETPELIQQRDELRTFIGGNENPDLEPLPESEGDTTGQDTGAQEDYRNDRTGEEVRKTRHRVFDGGNLLKAPNDEGVLIADNPENAYRLTGQSQIDDILESGEVRARKGKMRGGRQGETQWSKGHNKLWYDANGNKGQYLIESPSEGLNDRQGGLPVDEVGKIWKSVDGKWVDVTNDVKSGYRNDKNTRINNVQSELDSVNAEIEKNGDPDRTLAVRKKELEASLVSDPQSSQPTYQPIPQSTPGKNRVQREARTSQAIDEVVDSLNEGKTDPAEGLKIKEATRAALMPLSGVIDAAKVNLQSRSQYVKKNGKPAAATDKFFVEYHPESGDITMVLPESRSLVGTAPDPEALRTNRIPKRIEEEGIHIATLHALQNEWKGEYKKGKTKLSRGEYITSRLGQLATAFKVSDPAAFQKLSGVYGLTDEEGNPVSLSDNHAAGEMLRMIVQRMRTGQITEDINALDAQSRQKGTVGEQAKSILAKLLDAIRTVRSAINRYIVNPTPTIKKVVDDTNDILDKHKAILPPESSPLSDDEGGGGTVREDTGQQQVSEQPTNRSQPRPIPPTDADLPAREANTQRKLRESEFGYRNDNPAESYTTFSNPNTFAAGDDILAQAEKQAADSFRDMVDRNLASEPTDPVARDTGFASLRDFAPHRYYVSRQDQAAVRAASILQEHGARDVAQNLIINPLGDSLGLATDEGDVTVALYKATVAQLQYVASRADAANVDPAEVEKIAQMVDAMKQKGTEYIQGGGRASSMVKALDAMFTGLDAVKQYGRKLFGQFKNYDPKYLNAGRIQIEQWYKKWQAGAVTSKEFKTATIAAIRGIHKQAGTSNYRKAVKKTQANTVARQIGSPNSYVEDSDAVLFMAANDILNSEPSQRMKAYVDALSQRITFGMPITKVRTAENAILSAMSKTVKGRLEEAGIFGQEERPTLPTRVQQIEMILGNPEMYSEFVMNMEAEVASMYDKGANDPLFRERQGVFDELRANPVDTSVLQGAAQELMKKFKVRIPELIRKTWGEGRQSIVTIKEDFRKTLKDVTDNEPIINRLVENLDQLITSKQEEALNKLASVSETKSGRLSSTGVQRAISAYALDTDIKNIANIAKLSAYDYGEYKRTMAQYFSDKLGVPDTEDYPLASKLANTLSKSLDALVSQANTTDKGKLMEAAERLKNGLPEKAQNNFTSTLEKVIQAANRGFLDEPAIYEAVRQVHSGLNLPKYNPEFAAEIKERADLISMMPEGTKHRNQEIEELNRMIESKTPISAKDMAVSYGYFSMLSGPTTLLVTNPVSNFANLIAHSFIWSAQSPSNIGRIFAGIAQAASTSAKYEAGLALKTGYTPGRFNLKYMENDPMEIASPDLNPAFHKFSLVGKWPSRILKATDIYFNRLAFAAALGASGVEPSSDQARASALEEASRELNEQGINDPDGLRTKIRAEEILLQMKGVSRSDIEGADEKALTATFNQKPKGLAGQIAGVFDSLGDKNLVIRAMVPFTRVVANVLNEGLNYTPVGGFRAAFSLKQDGMFSEWRTEAGQWDKDIAYKAAIGTAVMGAMAVLFGNELGKEDPYIAVYGAGPADPNLRRQMRDMGWKPFTIKIGGNYYNYLLTPLAIACAWVGVAHDAKRDGKKDQDYLDYGMSLLGGAFNATMGQSFLSGVSDFFDALTAPDAGKAMGKYTSRMAGSVLVPNIIRQIDAMYNPELPEARSFKDQLIAQIPIVKHGLNPMLNVFGEPIEVNATPQARIVTGQKDGTLAFLTRKGISVPSYGRNSMIGNQPMTSEQYYQFVKLAGPKLKNEITRNLPLLGRMDKQEAQDLVDSIATNVKAQAKSEIARKFKIRR